MANTLVVKLSEGKIKRQDAYDVLTAVSGRRRVRVVGDDMSIYLSPGKRGKFLLTAGGPEFRFYETVKDTRITATIYYLAIGGYRIAYLEEGV